MRAIDASRSTRGEQALSTLKTLGDAKASVGPTEAASIFDLFDQVLGAKTGTTKIQGVAAVASSPKTDTNASDALLDAAYSQANA